MTDPAVPARPYRGVSADERRAERRARLVEAALDIAAADGVAAITVRGVGAKAGLTRRYFYESFDDLDALLLAVFADVQTEVATAVAAAAAENAAHPERAPRAAIGAGLAVLESHPGKARFISAGAGHPVLGVPRRAAQAAFTALVREQLVASRAARDDESADMTARFLVTGITGLIEAYLDGEVPATRDALVKHTAGLLVGLGRITS